MSNEQWDSILTGLRGGPLFLPEAGGDCAHSTFRFLPELWKKRVVAIDMDASALLSWQFAGIETRLETKNSELRGTLLPTDEHYRIKFGLNSPLSSGPNVQHVHNKARCYSILKSAEHLSVTLPQSFGAVIIRGNRSSGSKGTQTFSSSFEDDGNLIVEYLPHTVEYVVDFNTVTGHVYPRQTHRLRSGRDTACTLIGPASGRWFRIKQAVQSIARTLGIVGIGNIQLFEHNDRLYFVEAAMRLSGSSWVNSFVGANPLLGIPFSPFGEVSVTAQCGGAMY